MSGFVDNYVRQPGDRRYDPRAVMHYFTPEQVPVLSALARAFGVCDRWFSSAPCQTWPNRLFAHTGTAGGRVNNDTIPVPFFLPTVFRRLERHKRSWRVYFHDIPQTAALFDLWTRLPTHFRLFDPEFLADARDGRLPNYSFIEPRYFASLVSGDPPNDQHPPHNVVYGEQLIAAIYNALRSGAAWDRTLLMIIYDEHGGCYDHAPPPAATPPGPPYPDGFTFDRYGPRIPAVIVSPWIPAGSIIRPPEGAAPFDHASILATLHRLFDLGPPPTARVAAAPDLLDALSLSGPDNLGPPELRVSDARADLDELRDLHRQPRNGHQRRLRHPGAIDSRGDREGGGSLPWRPAPVQGRRKELTPVTRRDCRWSTGCQVMARYPTRIPARSGSSAHDEIRHPERNSVHGASTLKPRALDQARQ